MAHHPTVPQPTTVAVDLVSASPTVEPAFIAARLCYAKGGYDAVRATIDEMRATQSPDAVEAYMHQWLTDTIVPRHHWSIFEHLTFSVAVRGISRACSHQLVRHRIATYSQQSQRYVEKGDFSYLVPPIIAAVPEAMALYTEAIEASARAYQQLSQVLFDAYPDFNMPKHREKVFQDARFVLPNACETQIVITMNGRAWIEASRHRMCNRAQWEIREMFNQIAAVIRGVCPTVGTLMGGKCQVGECPTQECRTR